MISFNLTILKLCNNFLTYDRRLWGGRISILWVTGWPAPNPTPTPAPAPTNSSLHKEIPYHKRRSLII